VAVIDQALARRLAAPTFGVLALPTLVEAGLCPRWAARQARRGCWQCLARGIYVVHDGPISDLTYAHAGAAYAGPTGIVSGLVPLRMLGLRWLPTVGSVRVLVPDHVRRPDSRRVALTRTTGLDQLAHWNRGGVTLAPPDRAIIDASRDLSDLREIRGVVLGGVDDGHASAADLRSVLDAGQRNGSALTRRAIRDAERGCASPPEAELVDALIGCGQPFLVNPEVWFGDILVGRPDVHFLGRAGTGEVESEERHGSLEDRESTYDRHERFVGYGCEPTHISVRRIRTDVSEAAGHLLSQVRDSGPWPATLRVVPRGPVLR
jgi:hypothetical protein